MGVAIVFLIMGLVVVGGGLWYYRHASARYVTATTRWVQTEATILMSRIDVSRKSVNDTTVDDHVPVAAYSFVAGGAAVQGSRVALCAKDWSQRDAEAWLAAYPAGIVRPVWYDPTAPGDSALVLNSPSRTSAVILTVLGIALLVFAVMMFAKGHRP